MMIYVIILVLVYNGISVFMINVVFFLIVNNLKFDNKVIVVFLKSLYFLI